MMYGIDEQILENINIALSNQDKVLLKENIDNLTDRLNGVCFCHAYNDSECICGAWDGIWDGED